MQFSLTSQFARLCTVRVEECIVFPLLDCARRSAGVGVGFGVGWTTGCDGGVVPGCGVVPGRGVALGVGLAVDVLWTVGVVLWLGVVSGVFICAGVDGEVGTATM